MLALPLRMSDLRQAARVGLLLVATLGGAVPAATAAPPSGPEGCSQAASDACLQAVELPGGAGRLPYYVSRGTGEGGTPPTRLLLVMHGHPRDANRSFDAALQALRGSGHEADTLVVAPLFQVPAGKAGRCSTPGTPAAQPGDALWTCSSWLAGGDSRGDRPISSFAALDALLQALAQRWPSLREATLAGFSAGAQMLQHRIGFAVDAPAGWRVRYVIADPGTWLYFDPERLAPAAAAAAPDWDGCLAPDGAGLAAGCRWQPVPAADLAACPGYDDWKYGTRNLPAALGRSSAEARARYAAADIHRLEGARDSGTGRGTAARVLDKSCAAMLQGPYRLQRGLAHAAYEQQVLKPTGARSFAVVPGCAHDVACVLPSATGRAALFGGER
ncbi:hypothetical protein [Pseudacidovorax sp. RU35E]|uniref:hypothetical protein n=1 Tax=Pseudacidovorax sp. RU35E TaxID=1907403 RepID=UPI0009554563|nr:hypothetical protein [Pseudacidovorax sp. RU35E]SIR63992.1 hypothetical protein SAMN05880557_11570 [Pseudacidovorax sp. RU35E]